MDHPAQKYRPFPTVDLPDRQWPIAHAHPSAASGAATDLRDGNQALIEPMDAERKLRMFDALVQIGFKEIEVGFPSASQTDFDFVRKLIEEDLIPDDVTIQVLTQAREDLIERTFDRCAARRGRSCTCTTRRRRCSAAWCSAWTARASSTSPCRARAGSPQCAPRSRPPTCRFEYSPETFTTTELDFAQGDLRSRHGRVAADAASSR